MKKRVVYIMMFLVALLLGGCNLFSGLDKEDLDAPGAFEFKLDDAMANGEYTVVVGLIDSKIASSSELTALNNGIGNLFTELDSFTSTSSITDIAIAVQDITDYLDTNINNPSTAEAVKDLIGLKLQQAEANSGEAGLKLTDIIAELSESTSPSIGSIASSLKISSNSRINLGDVIPANLISEKLEAASKNYSSVLPISTGAAFDFLTGKYGTDEYLNASLAHIVCFTYDFIGIFSTNGNINGLVTSGAIDFETRKSNWNSNMLAWGRYHLKSAQSYLNMYVNANPNGLIKKTDLDKLNENMDDILQKIEITNANYDNFVSTAGF